MLRCNRSSGIKQEPHQEHIATAAVHQSDDSGSAMSNPCNPHEGFSVDGFGSQLFFYRLQVVDTGEEISLPYTGWH